jgi:hypothetical protein
MQIREANIDDWSAMWAFMREIIRAGETFRGTRTPMRPPLADSG